MNGTTGRGHPWMALLLAMVGTGAVTADAWGQDVADALSARFRQAAKHALPAVVSIRPQAPPAVVIPPVVISPVFVPAPTCSGVVVDATRGWVLTSNSALPRDPRIAVTFPDGREPAARSPARLAERAGAGHPAGREARCGRVGRLRCGRAGRLGAGPGGLVLADRQRDGRGRRGHAPPVPGVPVRRPDPV